MQIRTVAPYIRVTVRIPLAAQGADHMGMFSSKPPFDLTKFLAEKATTRPSSRRSPAWNAKPKPETEEAEADPKEE